MFFIKTVKYATLTCQAEDQPRLKWSSPWKREGQNKKVEDIVEIEKKEKGQQGVQNSCHTVLIIAMER